MVGSVDIDDKLYMIRSTIFWYIDTSYINFCLSFSSLLFAFLESRIGLPPHCDYP